MNKSGMYLLDRYEVMIRWKSIEPYLLRALKYNTECLTIDEVKKRVLKNHLSLWVMLDDLGRTIGCMATCVREFGNNTVCLVYFLSCDSFKHRYKPWLSKLKSWAKEKGANLIEVHGRLGWERFLKKDGFIKKEVVLNMEL